MNKMNNFENMKNKQDTPKVGVGMIIKYIDNNNIEFQLVGKRKNAHGSGLYSYPGGHVDLGETPLESGIREVFEETGFRFFIEDCNMLYFKGFTNDIFKEEGLHYITMYYECTFKLMMNNIKELKELFQNLEPEKCEGWEWHSTERILENPEEYFQGIIKINNL